MLLDLKIFALKGKVHLLPLNFGGGGGGAGSVWFGLKVVVRLTL